MGGSTGIEPGTITTASENRVRRHPSLGVPGRAQSCLDGPAGVTRGATTRDVIHDGEYHVNFGTSRWTSPRSAA
jgi:hypothetical protein